MNKNVLVLNSDFSPLHICSTQRAFILSLTDKVDVLRHYDSYMCSATEMYKVPSVIRLKNYIHRPYRDVQLTKKNVHIRDNYTCQYCGKQSKDLTVDHIIPIKKKGSFAWDNLVSCCKKCNNKKDCKTLEESGMVLKSKPKKPSFAIFFKMKHSSNQYWQDFLPNW